ncbi:FMN-binding protein [Roseateles sp. BYS78W]|uniref:FMN-binding protein n=1 Tax=Pelomonas candidula TaxID=3299025 RepID=A0ABW7HJX2_9BURK
MRLTLAPAALVALAPASAFAVTYLSPEQAAQLMFPEADRFESLTLPTEGGRPLGVRVAKKGGAVLGYVVLDDVIGKVELISYAVGIATDGSVRQVEILAYRESHGSEIRLPAWRKQFIGKTAAAPLRIGEDIANISGATLSCTHVTDGVRRIVATLGAARRAGALG